jgi:hypothetical protein
MKPTSHSIAALVYTATGKEFCATDVNLKTKAEADAYVQDHAPFPLRAYEQFCVLATHSYSKAHGLVKL